jgi:hypothetical protein
VERDFEDDRRDQDRTRVDNVGAGEALEDDEDLASVEDVGPEPAEHPAVDDV